MARIRSIKPAFFTSEDTCGVSPLARLLFLGLLTEADRAGRLEDRPRQLKRRLLPDDDCDVDALLWELQERGVIRRYSGAGEWHVVQIVNFEKHQKPHPKEAATTLPADGEDRKPELNTASREQVINHPVENPPSPRRNGSGDLSNGSGDLGSGVGTARAPVQGSGAFEPGSLPRDHMHHSICGPSMRLCLKTWECGELMRQYGGDPTKQKAAVAAFVAAFEAALGPDDAIGAFADIEKNFQIWMKSIGRHPAKIVPIRDDAELDAKLAAVERKR